MPSDLTLGLCKVERINVIDNDLNMPNPLPQLGRGRTRLISPLLIAWLGSVASLRLQDGPMLNRSSFRFIDRDEVASKDGNAKPQQQNKLPFKNPLRNPIHATIKALGLPGSSRGLQSFLGLSCEESRSWAIRGVGRDKGVGLWRETGGGLRCTASSLPR